MPSVDARRGDPGDRYVFLRQDGEEQSFEVISNEDGRIVTRTDDGCVWSRPVSAFGPNPDWKNCGGSSGQVTSAERLGGSIFPLAVGNTERWDYAVKSDTGAEWKGRRDCKVDAEVQITVPAGTFDTYHVRCEDKHWHWEWFVDGSGMTVQFAKTVKVGHDGANGFGQLVSYVPASG